MKRTPIDQPTYLRVKWGLENSRVWGVDPVEQLHEQGLIVTPELEKQLQIKAMEFILAEIEGWRPAEFIRRTNKSGTGATAADLHREILEFIREHINTLREAP